LLFQKDNSNRKDTHFWNVKRGGNEKQKAHRALATAGLSEEIAE